MVGGTKNAWTSMIHLTVNKAEWIGSFNGI